MKNMELDINFKFKRYHRINRIMDYIVLLAFIIFASTALLFLPYANMSREVESVKAFNENISNQLYILEQEFPVVEKPSAEEQAYSRTYEFLSSQEINVSNYIVNILDSQVQGINITNIQYNDSAKSVRVFLTASSEVAINEFMVRTYENYGIYLDAENESRWIVKPPVRISTTTNIIEVVFYYA